MAKRNSLNNFKAAEDLSRLSSIVVDKRDASGPVPRLAGATATMKSNFWTTRLETA